jgi:hypothetical protein
MSLGGILLGVINVAIVVAVLVLIGAVIVMFAKWLGWPIDWNVQRIYMLVVALIALYMLVALLLGIPTVRIIGFHDGAAGVSGAAVATVSTGTAADHS